ncbi:MAG: YabP/YqfC family sporulation protein, partial [Aristaeellaceae bacterium]
KAVVTGVTDVESFDDGAVVLHTHGGRLTLTGTGLHVSSLQLEEGRLTVDGVIDSAAYEGGTARRRGGFLRKALG